MKLADNVVFFIDETHFTALEEENISFQKDIVLLDFKLLDHKNQKQYYITYFPNINAENFMIDIEGEPVKELPPQLEIYKPQVFNRIYEPVKRIVQIPYIQMEMPLIRINGKTVHFNREDTERYVRTVSLYKKKVHFPLSKQTFAYNEGNDLEVINICQGTTQKYSINEESRFGSICVGDFFLDKVRVRSKKRQQLEYLIVKGMIELYYRLRIYKIKSKIDRVKFTDDVTSRMTNNNPVILKEELDKFMNELVMEEHKYAN